MPSGYTAALYDGEQDFRDFVLTTARGMGALIHMRDTSLDAEITMPEVSGYHKRRLEEAQQELREYEAYTDEEWEDDRDERYDEDFARWWEVEQKKDARKARYEDMLDKVWSWIPPSNDHVSFKQYMIDQIVESKKFDCHGLQRPVPVSVEEYKQDRLSKALRDVSYHSEELRKEHERVNERRRWIQQLLDSLPDE